MAVTSRSTGSLGAVAVEATSSTAQVFLQGAQVTSWRPRGDDDVLWMSSRSAYEPGRALRGGIPVCFPWFGPAPRGGGGPQHGFARTALWALDDVVDSGDCVELTLALTDSPSTLSLWPHRFRARLRLRIGSVLGVALEVTNTGEAGFTFGEALHTYLAVSDVSRATVVGLHGSPYVDKVAGEAGRQPATGAPLQLQGETDRVYLQPGGGLVEVHDPGAGRVISVRAQGSAHVVVWNPWAQKAASMSDVGDGEWRSMICVETANTFDREVDLAPGQTHTMSVTISVGRPGA